MKKALILKQKEYVDNEKVKQFEGKIEKKCTYMSEKKIETPYPTSVDDYIGTCLIHVI